ncbi:hypothetical protein BDP55DRAFT_625362 [Colletotrichum godetiae]|uniref:Uncharacterized protein n=1 Tax=Colletotrichum godetiae TaxID=1209918 RepID=A0AAJ0EZC7_9PEZI|nr:uncharacterized protein BDP55DRAFT_625362 [Colletotrichum godetiae]KAK1701114.1 hypothetical protein BDP55DRAFT_625362 [Colletotrichum godetiae]
MTTSHRPLEAQANAQRDPSKFPPGGLPHPCQCLTAQQLVQMDPERSEQERRQVGDEWILNGPPNGDQPDNAFGARHDGMLKTPSRQSPVASQPDTAYGGRSERQNGHPRRRRCQGSWQHGIRLHPYRLRDNEREFAFDLHQVQSLQGKGRSGLPRLARLVQVSRLQEAIVADPKYEQAPARAAAAAAPRSVAPIAYRRILADILVASSFAPAYRSFTLYHLHFAECDTYAVYRTENSAHCMTA